MSKSKGKKGRICGIYIRCSTKDQSDKESLKYQENECQTYIKNNRLAYYKTYQDIISGSTRHTKRSGMGEMFKDIEDGLIDSVVIQCLDRLCRDLDASGEINLFLKDHNTTLYQTSNTYDDTTFEGRSRKNVDRMMGQMELDKISERTKLGKQSKMRSVGWVGGRVPFGYSIEKSESDSNTNSDTKKIILPTIDTDEATVVRKIYELYWNHNKNIKPIVNYLNTNKIRSGKYNKTGTWSGPAIVRILKDHREKYYGGLINNNKAGNKWGKILNNEYGEYPRPNPSDDNIV